MKTLFQPYDPAISPKYSPNLFKFLNRIRRTSRRRQLVYREKSDGTLWIGEIEDGFMIGTRLMKVLCEGAKAASEIGAMVNLAHDLEEIPDFWSEYKRIGRCAIDPEHSMSFVGDEERYAEHGDQRACRWCGHKQWLHRWEVAVQKSAWKNAPELKGGAGE